MHRRRLAAGQGRQADVPETDGDAELGSGPLTQMSNGSMAHSSLRCSATTRV